MPLQRGDVLLQLQVQLPVAGTWRVTAGLGNSMLLHIGDVILVNPSAKEVEHIPNHSLSAIGGQRQRVQLPEAFESDSDEPHSASRDLASAHDVLAADGPDGVQVDYVLCVRGAGFVVDKGESNCDVKTAQSYTHSGSSFRCFKLCGTCSAVPAGAPLSVAVLQPQLIQHQPQAASLNRRVRERGGSWIISITPSPLILLPEQDVAAEAALSFPSLIGPDGLGSQRADSSSCVFTGLFVGCCVVSCRDDCAFPSPWPLQKNASE